MSTPPVRIVVRLPYNRPHSPDAALPDPPRVEWTPEKAEMFWRVYYQSRSNESRGADWRGLAAHLEVPLPYLLYRVNAKLQEDIRGLKDIQGSLSPATKRAELSEDPAQPGRRLGSARPYSSIRLAAPLGVRARLNSLGQNSPRPRKALSSSTLTVQSPIRAPVQHESPTSSDEDSEEEELARKEEEEERLAEQQEALDRKLKDLKQMMTKDTLGIVSSSPRAPVERGRLGLVSPSSMSSSYRQDTLSSRSASQSVSNTSSPQGSIPEIPSPSQESQPHSPVGRYLSPAQSSSPPILSPRNVAGRPGRHRPVADRNWGEQESNQGSETTSSFSDISDGSISASESALASALMSNIRGQGSRISQYAHGRMSRGPPY
ncbi:hypothetical protein BDN72DRAFT_836836 [Pluteus cervinus]|uniref:Uncharacterized protein n=1 Tax=Pluteus cervinus TaxID=181527 RepID=A0ACD3B236_9AGAR|nr:hypothetical protein BDN72DRAFT_836836 [Pluteus cervinus]